LGTDEKGGNLLLAITVDNGFVCLFAWCGNNLTWIKLYVKHLGRYETSPYRHLYLQLRKISVLTS